MSERNLGELLIEEGIRQLTERGMDGFSARAVAEACHVSCAAPFKYFDGKKEFLKAIAGRLDEELCVTMEEICEVCGDDHKRAHLRMGEAYTRFLCRYPFLIDITFWRAFEKMQEGIREWRSFQMIIEQFERYCEVHGISRDDRRERYFSFQTLAYGTAFVVNSGLLLKDEDPFERMRELQEDIYDRMEQITESVRQR